MRGKIALAFALLILPLLAAQQLYIPPFTLPATTCTNQFIRSIAAATGVGSCASIAAGDFPALTGDVTTAGGSLATTIAASAVTNAKLANMATTTIKGQTVGGSGAPVDLTAAQAAAVIGSVGGTLKSKLLVKTRDLTAASGSQAITGLGFTPTSCVGTGTTGTVDFTSVVGFADSGLASASIAVFGAAGATYSPQQNFFAFYDSTGSASQLATVSSYDADGLTLAWVKTGSPTGNATLYILCFR